MRLGVALSCCGGGWEERLIRLESALSKGFLGIIVSFTNVGVDMMVQRKANRSYDDVARTMALKKTLIPLSERMPFDLETTAVLRSSEELEEDEEPASPLSPKARSDIAFMSLVPLAGDDNDDANAAQKARIRKDPAEQARNADRGLLSDKVDMRLLEMQGGFNQQLVILQKQWGSRRRLCCCCALCAGGFWSAGVMPIFSVCSPLSRIFHPSVFTDTATQVFLLACKIHGAFFLEAFLLAFFGQVHSFEDGCVIGTTPVWIFDTRQWTSTWARPSTEWWKPSVSTPSVVTTAVSSLDVILVSVALGLVGSHLVFLILSRAFERRFVFVKARNVSTLLTYMQLRRLKDYLLLSFLITYLVTTSLLTSVFLAHVPDEDGDKWMVTAGLTLIVMLFIGPLLKSIVLTGAAYLIVARGAGGFMEVSMSFHLDRQGSRHSIRSDDGESTLISFVVQPGDLGLEISDKGIVERADPNETGALLGIKAGWTFVKIDDQAYSKELLQKNARGYEAYTITFQELVEPAVAEGGAVDSGGERPSSSSSDKPSRVVPLRSMSSGLEKSSAPQARYVWTKPGADWAQRYCPQLKPQPEAYSLLNDEQAQMITGTFGYTVEKLIELNRISEMAALQRATTRASGMIQEIEVQHQTSLSPKFKPPELSPWGNLGALETSTADEDQYCIERPVLHAEEQPLANNPPASPVEIE
jgi:hypothetical protein